MVEQLNILACTPAGFSFFRQGTAQVPSPGATYMGNNHLAAAFSRFQQLPAVSSNFLHHLPWGAAARGAPRCSRGGQQP
eukprot:630319-Alexandrium_andersonii.AAC.1